ncbi:Topoisomerase [Actinidia chinensis var. chinensis]|uniref:Topoisomerase n=1 Tax=Actinidia chinensis var. chinensis TaxID=1590841 RepID=A0A2R6QHQ6_ACTCC|nr:Topoisomerase [Actinidia chinensis var. chinensis]
MVNSRPARSEREEEAKPSRPKNKESTQNLREGQRKKKDKTHISVDNQTDNRTVETSKRKRTPDRTRTEVDLRHTLNAKWNKEADLRAKLDGRRDTVSSERVLAVLVVQAAPNERREAIPRYHTSFSRQIKGLDPLEKFTPPRFVLYDGKSDPRSHVSHVRQMVALKNHMDVLMCRVFPSSLGNLELKWFDKLPPGSIENFHQLAESFVARFVINTKLVQDEHLKEFIDEEKTWAKKGDAKPNPRFDRRDDDDEGERTVGEKEDRPLRTIHMIGGPRDTNLKNRIRREIQILKQIYEVLSVHSPAKKSRKEVTEPESITFIKADLERVQHPHSDPLVIQHRMNNYDVRRILMDTGSSVEVMYYGLFKLLKLTQSDLKSPLSPLVGFNAQSYWPLGMVTFKVRAGTQELLVEEEQEVLEDVGRDLEAKVVEDLMSYELDEPSLDRLFLPSANLEKRDRTELFQLLKANVEFFAWTPYEMTGIDPKGGVSRVHGAELAEFTVSPELRLLKILPKAGTLDGLSLVNKLGQSCARVRFTFDGTPALLGQWSPMRRQDLRVRRSPVPELDVEANKCTERAKAIVASEVPLISELGTITVMETWTKDDNRRNSQGTSRGKSHAVRVRRVSSLPTNTTIGAYRHALSHSPSSDGTAGTSSHALALAAGLTVSVSVARASPSGRTMG